MEFDKIKVFLTYLNIGLLAFFSFLKKHFMLNVSFDLTKYSAFRQILIVSLVLVLFVLLELLLVLIFIKVVRL